MGEKIRMGVYKPKRRVKVSKEDTVSVLVRLSGMFIAAGGFVSFILSGFIMGMKSFFDVKEKVDRRIRKRGYVELRIKK